jgi:hypothetical protein
MKFTIPTFLRIAKAAERPTLADIGSIEDPQLQRLALVKLHRLLDEELARIRLSMTGQAE